MQNQDKGGTAAAGQTRGGFYYKKVAKEVAMQIGLIVFLWFVFYYAAQLAP